MVTKKKKKGDTRTAHFKLFSVGLWKHPCERCTTLFEEGDAEGIKKNNTTMQGKKTRTVVPFTVI